MLGPGWSDTHGGQVSLNAVGAGGQPIHGGPFYSRAGSYYRASAGHMASNQVNYAWQLRDVPVGAGGFCLIPCSHKSRFPVPRPPTTSIDLAAVKHLTPNVGDIVFYHGGGISVSQVTRRSFCVSVVFLYVPTKSI